MFGESAQAMTLHFSDNYHPVLLAILPPGAFIGLGLLVALKNAIEQRRAQKAKTLWACKSPSIRLKLTEAY